MGSIHACAAFAGCIESRLDATQVVFRKLAKVKDNQLLFPFGNSVYDWYRKTISVGTDPRQLLSLSECQLFDDHIRQFKTGINLDDSVPEIAPVLAEVLRQRGVQDNGSP